MGREQPADWYDAAWESPRFRAPAAALPHRPLWRWIAGRIGQDERVVDLGCGPGHLAETLGERRGSFVGLDFSVTAIGHAIERNPWAKFKHADLRLCELPDADVYVACEVLEHIQADLELLGRIPVGRRVLMTLPTFDDTGHVRWFDSLQDVALRYADLLEFVELDELEPWFVIEGVRRG